MPFRLPKPDFSFASLRRLGATLALALAGGSLFAWLGLPAGWLSGALVVTAVAAMAGVPVGIGHNMRQFTFLMLGTSMGSAVSPDTLKGMTAWPLSLAVLALSIPVMMGAVMLYLERVAGWDRRSAFFAAAPGALSAVLVMAETSGADTRRVVFGQSVRIFVLVALLPTALGGLGHTPAGTLPINPVVPDAFNFALSLAAGLAGALAAERLRFPGGTMVGAMLASAAVHGSGLVEGRLPDYILIASFVAMGGNIGARFAGTRVETLRSFLFDALVALAIATAVTVVFALAGAWLADEDPYKMLVAYVPGALEAMTIMAFVLGLDPAFVAAHHLARFLLLALAIPVIARLMFPALPAVPSENVDPDPDETKD